MKFKLEQKDEDVQPKEKLRSFLTKEIEYFSMINDVCILFVLFIFLFIYNAWTILKNSLRKMFSKILKKLWCKLINCEFVAFNNDFQKNKFHVSSCSICLNFLRFRVSIPCSHNFCGKNFVSIYSFFSICILFFFILYYFILFLNF